MPLVHQAPALEKGALLVLQVQDTLFFSFVCVPWLSPPFVFSAVAGNNRKASLCMDEQGISSATALMTDVP